MIEPLHLNIVHAPPSTAKHPVFCENCKARKETRTNPNIAIKFCVHCMHRKFLCKRCDEEIHRLKPLKLHVRSLIVVGHGVSKKVLNKGDGKTYPKPLDMVSVKVRTDVYQDGNKVLREPYKEAFFETGLSGDCIHVQILGAKRILAASKCYRTSSSTEQESISSPFISSSYAGRDLGDTKIRSHNLRPRWDNETVIVPVEDAAALRNVIQKFETLQQMDHWAGHGKDKGSKKGRGKEDGSVDPKQQQQQPPNPASASSSVQGQGLEQSGSETNTAPAVTWELSSERKAKNSLRLEVYDYDTTTRQPFLGHVELNSDDLMEVAVFEKEEAISLPIKTRHQHGVLELHMGTIDRLPYFTLLCLLNSYPTLLFLHILIYYKRVERRSRR